MCIDDLLSSRNCKKNTEYEIEDEKLKYNLYDVFKTMFHIGFSLYRRILKVEWIFKQIEAKSVAQFHVCM